jgi:ABC-type multidrug transport system ATPase subunit
VIVTRSITKRYGPVLAVDQVDLDVREGDRYGFLGPNGSGKTTLIRMLLGLVYATSGEIEVMGKPMPSRAAEVLPQVGALIEGPSSYGHLSGRANLALLDAAGRAGRRRTRRARIAEALDRVGLAGIDSRPVKRYSLGMRQRLGLAAALLRTPRLLVLDEPTNGLDPQGIREIRDLLAELNKAGTTVFLSSHQLAEVEQLCTRVGVIDRGRLVVQEDLAELRGPTGRVLVRTPDVDRAVALLNGRVERIDGDALVVADPDSAALNLRLVAAGVRVAEIGPERRSLEQLVLAVTGSGSDRVDRPGGGQPFGRGWAAGQPSEGDQEAAWPAADGDSAQRASNTGQAHGDGEAGGTADTGPAARAHGAGDTSGTGGGAAHTQAEHTRAEQTQAEQTQAEQTQAEQTQAEQTQAGGIQ